VIKFDILSFTLALLSVMVAAYLYVVVQFQLALVPLVLLLAGMMFSYIMSPAEVDQELEESLQQKNIMYTGLALLSFAVFSFVIKFLPLSVQKLSVVDAMLLGVLMAVSEEYFFRGAITQFFMTRFSEPVAVVMSGIIFAAYHTAVYGQMITSLVYAALAGMVLSYIFVKTKSLTPTILAHTLNNIIAVI